MWALLLTIALGCRNEDKEVTDTSAQALTPIGDVDAMAEAWCAMLSCREGFYDAFPSVERCVEVYANYWGNANQLNNTRECFEDVPEVEACTGALEAVECGGDTPAACCELIQCQDPGDTEKEDTGADVCE